MRVPGRAFENSASAMKKPLWPSLLVAIRVTAARERQRPRPCRSARTAGPAGLVLARHRADVGAGLQRVIDLERCHARLHRLNELRIDASVTINGATPCSAGRSRRTRLNAELNRRLEIPASSSTICGFLPPISRLHFLSLRCGAMRLPTPTEPVKLIVHVTAG